jgi:hypothetical protein
MIPEVAVLADTHQSRQPEDSARGFHPETSLKGIFSLLVCKSQGLGGGNSRYTNEFKAAESSVRAIIGHNKMQ